jgi:hypothetical protein
MEKIGMACATDFINTSFPPPKVAFQATLGFSSISYALDI